MMKINVVVLGKLKEKYLKDAEAEYLKRLKPFAKVEIIELREESFTEKDPVGLIKEREGLKIKQTLEKFKNSFIVALDEKGEQCSSVDFSQKFQTWAEQNSTITFVIGGPLGLSSEVIEHANYGLSLSSLTFTHQMARIILLEQVYRARMIHGGRKYHY